MQQKCSPSRQFFSMIARFTTIDSKRRVSTINLMEMYSHMKGSQICRHNFKYVFELIQREKAPRMLLKYLYLVHGCIQYHNYESGLLEQLQDISFPQLFVTNPMQEWLQQVCQNYFKYLIRICLNQQLYSNLSVGRVKQKAAIIDTFLIINLFNMSLVQAKHTFNVAGRYYLKTLFEFQDMYDIVRKQFENMYEYMRVLITKITDNYAFYSVEQMGCFLEAMMEVDLINDNFEEIQKNKYYSTYKSISLMTLSSHDESNLIQYVLQN